MLVRVFVHNEKPTAATSSLLVCSLSDPDSSSVVSTTGWHLPANITYRLNPSSVPQSVGSANLPTISQNSYSDWSQAIPGKVSFTRGSDTSLDRSLSDNKNIIAFRRLQSGSLGITYIRYYVSSGLVVDVDTLLNNRYQWKWANSNVCANTDSYDIEAILTHEIGHWVGMNDEYSEALFKDATMYGYANKGEVKKNTLTSGDTLGAQSIYP